MIRNLDDLKAIKHDNHRRISKSAVDSLVKSIKEVGLQEPIRLFEIAATGELYVVSGHHRLEAMKRVQDDPAFAGRVFSAWVVKGTQEEYESQKTVINAVLSNMLRTDLDLLDRAGAYSKLRATGLSAAAIAAMVNKDKRTIEMTLNVALLPEDVQDWIRKHPKIKDSVVYKLAARYKREPDLNLIRLLRESLAPRGRLVQGATAMVRVNKTEFREKLTQQDFLTQSQIDQILSILEA